MVVGVCKDAHNELAKAYNKLSKIPELRSAKWFVVESNSSEQNKQALFDMQNDISSLEVVSIGDDNESLSRVDRIRKARNRYVDEIRSSLPDRVLVIDFDKRLLRLIRIKDVLRQAQGKTILTARQSLCYYDVFALKKLGQSGSKPTRGRLNNWIFRTVPLQICMTFESRRGIKVASAFGGLAIYPGRVFTKVDYGKPEASEESCEHIYFHESAKKYGFDCYVHPELVYGLTNEHCFALSPFFLIRGLLRGLLSGEKAK